MLGQRVDRLVQNQTVDVNPNDVGHAHKPGVLSVADSPRDSRTVVAAKPDGIPLRYRVQKKDAGRGCEIPAPTIAKILTALRISACR